MVDHPRRRLDQVRLEAAVERADARLAAHQGHPALRIEGQHRGGLAMVLDLALDHAPVAELDIEQQEFAPAGIDQLPFDNPHRASDDPAPATRTPTALYVLAPGRSRASQLRVVSLRVRIRWWNT